MLTTSEIRQLSDSDLRAELARARDLLFRQRLGVHTKHLKDSHIITILKKLIAQILTIVNARKQAGVAVETSASEVVTKLKTAQAALEKKAEKKSTKKAARGEAVEDETSGVKVKKAEK